METVISKEDIKTDENDDFFVTLESAPQLENRAIYSLPIRHTKKLKRFEVFMDDLFGMNGVPVRRKRKRNIAEENTPPAGVCDRLSSAVISKEDVKTEENDDSFVTLENAPRQANNASIDLFAANPTYEKIEENSKVSVPSTSEVIKEEEYNTGSSLTAKKVSLLETNENIFGSSSCESSNFIGTSGTYCWDVDPSSGVSRLYQTHQHAFEMGELGEDTKSDSATSQENGLTLLSTSALKEEENISSSVLHSNAYPVSSGMRVTEVDRNTLDDVNKPDSTTDEYYEPSTKPDPSAAKDYQPSKSLSVADEITSAGDRHRTKCSFCDKRFPSNWHRHRHETIHTGQKSYECPVCKKCFSRRDKCQLHQRTHTGDVNKPDSSTAEDCQPSTKPDSSTAEDCQPSTKPDSSTAEDYQSSKNRHRTKCSFCDKRFRSNWDRHRHETIHKGQKSYECPVCKKCFSRRDKYQSHQRTHTDERPYICSACGQCFKFQSSLCKHEHLHTVATVGPVPRYLAKDGPL